MKVLQFPDRRAMTAREIRASRPDLSWRYRDWFVISLASVGALVVGTLFWAVGYLLSLLT